jgi:uncharacterized protein YlbG (UPF0298 family)
MEPLSTSESVHPIAYPQAFDLGYPIAPFLKPGLFCACVVCYVLNMTIPATQIAPARRVVAFLLRMVFFRNRGMLIDCGINNGRQQVSSCMSAGERVIDYLTSIGVLERDGNFRYSNLINESDIDEYVESLVDDRFVIEATVAAIVYHFSCDVLSPERPQFFVAMPMPESYGGPQLEQEELDQLAQDLVALDFLKRIDGSLIATEKMRPAFEGAYISDYKFFAT